MSVIIVKSPYNGGEITTCQLPGKVLGTSCSKGCYENGRECEFHLSQHPFCKKADEFIAEYKRNKEVAE